MLVIRNYWSTSCLKHAFLSCQYQMKILNIFEIFSYQVSCFVFQHNNNLLPQPIASLFTVNSEMHHHNTRQKHNLHFAFNKLSFSIRSQGPKIWNSIPYTLRNSLKTFNYKRIWRITTCLKLINYISQQLIFFVVLLSFCTLIFCT
jgi:hypothetical protein